VFLAAKNKMGYVGNRRLEDMKIEIDREEDGRWIAEIPELPGAMGYGESKEEAVAKVEALALRILADSMKRVNACAIVGSV